MNSRKPGFIQYYIQLRYCLEWKQKKISRFQINLLPLHSKTNYMKKDLIGKKIKIIYMEDNFPVPPNTTGTIVGVDDMNVIHVKWNNGSTLGVLPDVDKFIILD